MIIHFKRDEVERLANHSREATQHKPLYEQPETEKPGLWLVGDDGVYLMSNARSGLRKDPEDPESHFVVAYAIEICPVDEKGNKKASIDDWWETKRQAFGGDDGADFIPYESDEGPSIKGWLESNEGELLLPMDLTPQNFSLVGSGLYPEKKGAVKVAAGPEFDKCFKEGIKWSAWAVPVVEMDRPGMVAYIGALKLANAKLQKQLDAARQAGAALLEPQMKPKAKLKVPKKSKK